MEVVRTHGLTKSYPNGVTALAGLDLAVNARSTGLVGANGAGKSTFFRLLLGLLPPTSGTIEVCGIDVATDPVGVRARIGYMPEHDCLPTDQSAADAVAMLGELSGLPAGTARRRASEVLDLVQLDEARFRPIGGYSTGMKQRAKLAQALVAGPQLVLLDEPTAGLDPGGRDEMLALVKRVADLGVPVIMATHLLDDVAMICEHVLVLDGGRLVSDSSVQSLQTMTSSVTVDVGPAGRATLLASLAEAGLTGTATEEGTVEVTLEDDSALDLLRDIAAQRGLPLFRLSSRRTSLDDVFTRSDA
ncbi:MAG: transporter ATP-binding protein [Frankiales bacterium]|nr:transporter ATP-binding protein [Frankiales bacterium]